MYFFVVVGSSQAEPMFDVNVAASYFPEWNGEFGDHHMTSAAPLAGLQPGASSLRDGAWLYTYDGSQEGACIVLDRIGLALKEDAMPFFVLKEQRALTDAVFERGLTWLRENRYRFPATLLRELDAALRRVTYPLLDELKAELRAQATATDAPKWTRREIRVLGLHLLEFAGRVMLSVPAA